ncbi:MAG: VCBS repeat-containing protein [Caldilineaceae bacterium]|nr:VCBS repeat-containing protein [Caldilineaceae bacterium]
MNWKIGIPASLLLISMAVMAAFTANGSPPGREPAQAATVVPAIQNTPTPSPSQNLRLYDAADAARLHFIHGAFRESVAEDPVAMMGGGLCWLDFDQDGWLDLYVVNSHALHEVDLWQQEGGLPRNALFRNRGDGAFEDVSAGSGADLIMRGNGCVAGDINGNGYPDLYVTADGPNALLLNQGDGTFVDVAHDAGVDAPEWSTAAALADVDNDGLIDIFVGAYIDLEKTVPNPIGIFPQDFLGLPNRLYLNGGDGTFEEVTVAAGITHEERTLGAIFTDVDGDGRLDLFVANDGEPNRLYHNIGGAPGRPRFEDVTATAGVGDRNSGMGVSAGDYTGDGMPDLVITNFGMEYNSLYRNDGVKEGVPVFEYATFRMGLAGFGREQTGWGVAWLDLNLDGHLDLFTAQGKVPVTGAESDREFIRFYRNRGDGTFLDASRMVGQQEIGPLLARGMAVADYDNDGVLDLAIATIGGPLVLLKATGVDGNWLLVDLPYFSPGARLQATLPNGQTLVREIHSGSSYLASEETRFHLGLGEATEVARLKIDLPSGEQLVYENVEANQILRLPADGLPAPIRVPDPAPQPAMPSTPVAAAASYSSVAEYGSELAQDWMQLFYNRIQADRLSPPAAARIFAYTGVTLYEAVLPGMPGYRTLQGQLNDMPALPQPGHGPYNWATVAASAVATVATGLFETAESRAAVESLRAEKLAALAAAGIAPAVLERSRLHGERLGRVILGWAWTDGYWQTRDRSYSLPEGAGYWRATSSANNGQPLEPYWAELRPFALTTADACAPPAHKPFSTEPDSLFYAEAKAVYDADRALGEEERAIALFWADTPGETGTPPGHWISIVNQLAEAQHLDLGQTAELHALIGITLADSFISCWEEKYNALLMRPVTYIRAHIDEGWQPLIATPPFPEYTSGHSVASAAAAAILTSRLGDISFTDATHSARGMPPRNYVSFAEAAQEAAISRLYGGIHYPMAIENGLTQGECVGRAVLERVKTRE